MGASDKRQKMLAGSGVLLLLVAAGVVWRTQHSGRPESGQYFYDLNAGTRYVDRSGAIPPAIAPSGGEGVYAAVFACGQCDDPARQFVAYLQTNTAELKSKLSSGNRPEVHEIFGGTLLRAPNSSEWVTLASKEGKALERSAAQRCSSAEPAVPCLP